MKLTQERRKELGKLEARLEAQAVKNGQKAVIQRWEYSPACIIRVDGLIGGRKV